MNYSVIYRLQIYFECSRIFIFDFYACFKDLERNVWSVSLFPDHLSSPHFPLGGSVHSFYFGLHCQHTAHTLGRMELAHLQLSTIASAELDFVTNDGVLNLVFFSVCNMNIRGVFWRPVACWSTQLRLLDHWDILKAVELASVCMTAGLRRGLGCASTG